MYLFNPMVAIDANTHEVILSGSGQVYAPSDESFSTPLTVTPLSGIPTTTINVDARGLTDAFYCDIDLVVWKSGQAVTTIWSPDGIRLAAQESAASAASSAAAATTAAAGVAQVIGDGQTVSNRFVVTDDADSAALQPGDIVLLLQS